MSSRTTLNKWYCMMTMNYIKIVFLITFFQATFFGWLSVCNFFIKKNRFQVNITPNRPKNTGQVSVQTLKVFILLRRKTKTEIWHLKTIKMDTEAIYSYLTGMVISFTSDITMVRWQFSQLYWNMFICIILYYRPWIATRDATCIFTDMEMEPNF